MLKIIMIILNFIVAANGYAQIEKSNVVQPENIHESKSEKVKQSNQVEGEKENKTKSPEEVDRKISDLMYLPSQGNFVLEMGVKIINTKLDATYLGMSLSEQKIKSQEINSIIAYSITDDTSIGIGLDYTLKNDNDVKYGPASTINGTNEKYKSKGLKDITFGGQHRLFEDNIKKTKCDLTLKISPKSGDAEEASTTKEGNEYRGGNLFSGNIEFGKKIELKKGMISELKGEAEITFNGEENKKELADDSKTKIKSNSQITFTGTGRLHFNDRTYGDLSLGLGTFDDIESTNAGTKTTYKFDTVFIVGLSLGYTIIPESLLAEISYARTSYDVEITDGTTKFDVDTNLNGFSLSVFYRF